MPVITAQCLLCKRLLPIEEFGKNKRLPRGIHYYCRRCVNNRYRMHSDEELMKKVRLLYGGRCSMCNSFENLEIVPTMEIKKRNARAMILICSACKRDGIPTVTNYLRKCFRCGHVWFALKTITITCPKCKSPYWHLPKQVKT